MPSEPWFCLVSLREKLSVVSVHLWSCYTNIGMMQTSGDWLAAQDGVCAFRSFMTSPINSRVRCNELFSPAESSAVPVVGLGESGTLTTE